MNRPPCEATRQLTGLELDLEYKRWREISGINVSEGNNICRFEYLDPSVFTMTFAEQGASSVLQR